MQFFKQHRLKPSKSLSDTNYLIFLTNIGEIDLLHKGYGQIVTTIDIATHNKTLFLLIFDIYK